MAGYVYAVTNEAMPGLVKIGITSRPPSGRIDHPRRLRAFLSPASYSLPKWLTSRELLRLCSAQLPPNH